MPVGNGRMGALVWTVPSSLKFQLNRVDVFGNSSGSNSFYERNTDYCNGTGYMDIDFGQDGFIASAFHQHGPRVALFRNGKKAQGLKGGLLSFATARREKIMLQRERQSEAFE